MTAAHRTEYVCGGYARRALEQHRDLTGADVNLWGGAVAPDADIDWGVREKRRDFQGYAFGPEHQHVNSATEASRKVAAERSALTVISADEPEREPQWADSTARDS
ncbi:MAG TPA: hypothetical protein VLJ11_03135 [Bryobacteraceae bacterium]|nr:hypothetical protein [Bryobacteraceae bacterium]